MSYSEDEFDYEDKDDDFVAEFAARERVGSGRPTFIDVNIDIQKGRKGRMSLKNELSPDQLFLFDLQKNYYKYNEDIPIGSDDIDLIKMIVLRIEYIEYKNPLAFLLGYYILEKGKKRDTDPIIANNLDRVGRFLKNIEGIEIEDVIRYSRLIGKYI
jgi:hypothetical protein